MKRDLDATKGRVSRLEQEIKSMRGSLAPADGQVSYRDHGHTPPPSSNRSADGSYHRVQAGETLSSIARRWGVGVDRIVAENRITNPNALRIGQELFIPGRKGNTANSPPPASGKQAAPPSPAPQSGGVHTVQPGETLYRIARKYGISADEIVHANGMRDPNALRVGQRLTIPGAGSSAQSPDPQANKGPKPAPAPNPSTRGDEVVAPPGYGFYQVAPGDTLHSIAISFGTNTKELRNLNELRGDSLHVGDFLLVPVPDASLYES